MGTDSSQRPNRSVITTFFKGLGGFRRAWPQFFAADVATRVAATLVLTPLVAWVARGAVGRAGGGAVTDQDILWFVLSPLGIATVLLVSAGAILAGFFGHTAIMTVAAGIEEDRAVSWLAGLRHGLNRLFGIFELAAILGLTTGHAFRLGTAIAVLRVVPAKKDLALIAAGLNVVRLGETRLAALREFRQVGKRRNAEIDSHAD